MYKKEFIYQCPGCDMCKNPRTRYRLSAKGDSDKEFKIFECPNCGIVFTYPRPDKKELEEYYDHSYYGEEVRRLYVIRDLFMRMTQLDRRKVIEKYMRKGRLMDIGCGDGQFLKEMIRYGWEVYGIETAKATSNSLKEIKGIKYFNGELVHFNFPSDYFDVITLWHVLEHLPDPFLELKEIARILKKSGWLFIAAPNFNSLQARFGQNRWVHLDPPWHLWHFSSKSLAALIKKSGLGIKHQIFLSYPYNLFGWWQTILNRCGLPFNHLHHIFKREEAYKKLDSFSRFSAQLFIAVSIFFMPVYLLLTLLEVSLGRGGIITMVARRK